jgi:hypothetical protein
MTERYFQPLLAPPLHVMPPRAGNQNLQPRPRLRRKQRPGQQKHRKPSPPQGAPTKGPEYGLIPPKRQAISRARRAAVHQRGVHHFGQE